MAVDKAPLDPAISAMIGVSCRQESAFGLIPPAGSAGRLVVLGLHPLSGPLARLGAALNFVCTLKFQSEADHATAAEFDAIPGACLLQGGHNKHELTFALLR
jgi:23S rRNA (cytidine2498-2'-O)-methyltransferase